MNHTFFIQHTIAREVRCRGVGLHSGAQVTMKLKPAPPNSGVRFRRMDISGHPTVFAHHDHVIDTFLATTIGYDGIVVSTIEHLMAALSASHVNNVLIEIDGPEVPIFDGSAAPYSDVISQAGVKEQRAFCRVLRLQKPFLVTEGDAYIKAIPSSTFSVHYIIDFPHPLIGRQELRWSFSQTGFDQDIARARTFGFLKDVQRVQRMGLARGGSLNNTIVFDDYGMLNREGFRYADECVRHKVLDFIGDLALAGTPIAGHFVAYKAGHALHHRLLRELGRDMNSSTNLKSACMPAAYFPPTATPEFLRHFPSTKPL